ncbi:hypothetical protein [Haloarcula pelagica]|uniref:hypothetical protein n=1 Tax=Haloarcula pelagica TaxID=3033389 RepID=UPI0024C2D9C7|nr:hypothetical protein [Halomicroarcula sp. YJ-61-S]
MSKWLELPTGDRVGPDDVFLYNGYPYRLVWLDHEKYDFELSPLYWGDSGMDIPFQDREALVDQWGTDSRGLLTDEEWAGWIEDAREDDRFGEQEVAELARELPGDRAAGADTSDGGGGGLRDILGL